MNVEEPLELVTLWLLQPQGTDSMGNQSTAMNIKQLRGDHCGPVSFDSVLQAAQVKGRHVAEFSVHSKTA